MKKGLILCAALVLSACSSSVDNTWYQLTSGAAYMQGTSSQRNEEQAMGWVQQVTVPDYLAGKGRVDETSEVK